MARPRSVEYPEPQPGTVPHILRELIRRDGRSMRAISLAAGGLSPDAARNAIRLADAQPRRKTLDGLAKALGVDVRVILGQVPIPGDLPASGAEAMDNESLPLPKAPAAKPPIAAAVKQAGGGQVVATETGGLHRALHDEVRVAMERVVAAGISPRAALRTAVQAALLTAISTGLDHFEALEILLELGGPI